MTEMLGAGQFSPVHVETVDLEIVRSEVPFDLGGQARDFVKALSELPDAVTYQFVVVAYPTTPLLGSIPLLLGQLHKRLAELIQQSAVENAA